jgi:sialic acid synthase SpsE
MDGDVMFVIAELCSNVRPFDLVTLRSAVAAAATSGAQAVKVQVFSRSHFPRSEREQKRAVEFPRSHLSVFVKMAHAWGIQAGASVFDEHAVDCCFDAGCDFLKLASREAYNGQLVGLVLETQLPVYTSFPWPDPLLRRAANETPLICVTEYPTWSWPDFGRKADPWGWSSHTPHYQDVLQAVASGASVIEKHFALSPQDPEAAWSLLPQTFKEMCDAIRA